MATMSFIYANPFRSSYKYLQRSAHEQPVLFYSILVGLVGPIAVVTVPPIRRQYGWKPSEKIPSSYPIPDRPRENVQGFDDE